jgi:carboxyl-terminal processing protease
VGDSDEGFYRQLQITCTQIVDLYFRPVTVNELYLSAVKGLFAKTGRPIPAELQSDLGKATTDKDLAAIFRRARDESGRGKDYLEDLLVCMEAIASSLDPYTKIIHGEEQRVTAPLQTDSEGLGLEIAPHLVADTLRITAVLPGGPAQRAGLRPGDVITHFNGKPIRSLSSQKVDELLGFIAPDGPPSLDNSPRQESPFPQPLEITCRRTGASAGSACGKTGSAEGGPAQDHKATLQREHFRVETVLGVSRFNDNSWNYFLDPIARVAHVRLATLAKGTAQELRAVLSDLQGQKARGLILDLRWCPGGYLEESVECARLFLDGEKVLTTVKSRKRDEVVYRANQDGAFANFPIVVLVNAGTTGGAELIAAALEDHGRATVGGQRSFGKASVQTPVHLGMPYTGMRLTSGTFQRPNGKNLHRFPESKLGDDWGVCPDADLECRLSPAADRALKDAWQLQALRPGSSRERLALDDPMLDVARNMALEFLLNTTQNRER